MSEAFQAQATDSPDPNDAQSEQVLCDGVPGLCGGVPVEATFAEAFDMKATRLILTADDRRWCREAAAAMVGFGTSVIACGVEIAVERSLTENETPDGRPGVAILAFAVSGRELEKQIPRRAGQCVLTCPTTALYAGLAGDRSIHPKRIPLGQSLRYFGDGHQISKVLPPDSAEDAADIGANGDTEAGGAGARYWRIPVMDGEFVCQHDVGRVDAIGGGNFILLARSVSAATIACRAAVDAMAEMPGVITPFPGGATRSGSKVGSKYPNLFASTNDAFCPTLRDYRPTKLPAEASVALEVVIDGMSAEAIAAAMAAGVRAACEAAGPDGLVAVTAGNYGGKLGRHHFHLHRVLGSPARPTEAQP